jgi:hypothetical protein
MNWETVVAFFNALLTSRNRYSHGVNCGRAGNIAQIAIIPERAASKSSCCVISTFIGGSMQAP